MKYGLDRYEKHHLALGANPSSGVLTCTSTLTVVRPQVWPTSPDDGIFGGKRLYADGEFKPVLTAPVMQHFQYTPGKHEPTRHDQHSPPLQSPQAARSQWVSQLRTRTATSRPQTAWAPPIASTWPYRREPLPARPPRSSRIQLEWRLQWSPNHKYSGSPYQIVATDLTEPLATLTTSNSFTVNATSAQQLVYLTGPQTFVVGSGTGFGSGAITVSCRTCMGTRWLKPARRLLFLLAEWRRLCPSYGSSTACTSTLRNPSGSSTGTST